MKPGPVPGDDHVALVFGGRSPIAIACALELAKVQDVVLVTRRVDEILRKEVSGGTSRLTLVPADLAVAGTGRDVAHAIYSSGRQINAAVFLQRYRPDGPPQYADHAAVELWSIEETLKEISRLKHANFAVQALVSSSPAAEKVVVDQDLAYHIVKAGQEALVRFMAVELARHRIRVNAVQIGSVVLKERARDYWDSIPEVVKDLRRLTPEGSLLTSGDVGRLLAELALNTPTFTGATLRLDGAMGLRDGVQLAKLALEDVSSNPAAK